MKQKLISENSWIQKENHITEILTQGVSFRMNLNIESTKLAGVDSVHPSNSETTHDCRVDISLKQNKNINFIVWWAQKQYQPMYSYVSYLHCSTPITNFGKFSIFGVSVGMFFTIVVLKHLKRASFLSLKHSGPFSAMNKAIWSPSLKHTKFSRFVKIVENTFL